MLMVFAEATYDYTGEKVNYMDIVEKSSADYEKLLATAGIAFRYKND
jgi:hypothetical protein